MIDLSPEQQTDINEQLNKLEAFSHNFRRSMDEIERDCDEIGRRIIIVEKQHDIIELQHEYIYIAVKANRITICSLIEDLFNKIIEFIQSIFG